MKQYESPRVEFTEFATDPVLKDSGSIVTPIIPFKGKHAGTDSSSVSIEIFKD